MAYTVWCRGQLLGESDLGYVRVFPKHRMGDFTATDEGEGIIQTLTAVSSSVIALGKVLQSGATRDASREEVLRLTEYADYAAAMDARATIELELRGPDGNVIPTEWVEIRDAQFLAEIGAAEDETRAEDAGEDDEEVRAMMREMEEHLRDLDIDESWRGESESAFPRYQIQVMLEDEWSVP